MASDEASDNSTSAASQHEKDGTAKVLRRQSVVKFRKAPEAPKNPKTAFFFFSMHMHDERKKGASKGSSISNKVPDAAKQISMAWKALAPEEKKKFEEKAEKDKLRYKVEKSLFSGRLIVVKGEKRAKKDSEAPKRPMSAFLDFSTTLRSQVIKDNPHVTDNKEITKILGSMWRNATDEEKQPFIDKELLLRDQYNEKIRQYKKEKKERQAAERKYREAKVIDAIENGRLDELIQATEESKQTAPLKAMPENVATARESSLSDRVDHSYASQYLSISDQPFTAHYQSHTSAHGSYGERFYNTENNTTPLFPQESSYTPQYQNIFGYNAPFISPEVSGGSHNCYGNGQWLPDNHQHGTYPTSDVVQNIHQHWAQNSNAHTSYQQGGVQNQYLSTPQYNTGWMDNANSVTNSSSVNLEVNDIPSPPDQNLFDKIVELRKKLTKYEEMQHQPDGFFGS